jgi:hypothetical protein
MAGVFVVAGALGITGAFVPVVMSAGRRPTTVRFM